MYMFFLNVYWSNEAILILQDYTMKFSLFQKGDEYLLMKFNQKIQRSLLFCNFTQTENKLFSLAFTNFNEASTSYNQIEHKIRTNWIVAFDGSIYIIIDLNRYNLSRKYAYILKNVNQ